jgi:1-acyl-sn-glycerol-3-phosphate acyltransferase
MFILYCAIMKSIAGYLISPVYWFVFWLLLIVFHPIQVVCRRIGGYPLRKNAVDVMNFLILYSLTITGARIRFNGFDKLPEGRPLIIVSNHQNTFDIPAIVWGFRKHHPKFVSKIELGKGIPSISYNLRHGGSALIDRSNPRQSIVEIMKLGKHIEKENYSASIFPEGTRSKTGEVKTFKHGGIEALLRASPSAWIVPFVIDGNSRLLVNGYFPLTVGVKLSYTVLPPINPAGRDPKELAKELEGLIKSHLRIIKKQAKAKTVVSRSDSALHS